MSQIAAWLDWNGSIMDWTMLGAVLTIIIVYMFLKPTKYDWPDVDEDDIDLDTFQRTRGGTTLFDGAPYEEREEPESPTLFDSDPYGEKGKGKGKGKE